MATTPTFVYVVYWMYEEDMIGYNYGKPTILGTYTSIEKARRAGRHYMTYGMDGDILHILTDAEDAELKEFTYNERNPDFVYGYSPGDAIKIGGSCLWCVRTTLDDEQPGYKPCDTPRKLRSLQAKIHDLNDARISSVTIQEPEGRPPYLDIQAHNIKDVSTIINSLPEADELREEDIRISVARAPVWLPPASGLVPPPLDLHTPGGSHVEREHHDLFGPDHPIFGVGPVAYGTHVPPGARFDPIMGPPAPRNPGMFNQDPFRVPGFGPAPDHMRPPVPMGQGPVDDDAYPPF